ncbi:hypothetical protein [Dubosiella newyorkensis]
MTPMAAALGGLLKIKPICILILRNRRPDRCAWQSPDYEQGARLCDRET